MPEKRTTPRTPVAQYREMDIDIEELNRRLAARATGAADGARDDDVLIPVALSSEAPVLRYDWWEGEEYFEVLDHAKSSIDTSYAKDGLPFMMSHRSYDGDAQHGIVENITAGADRIMRGDIRMSNAARSQEVADDIRRKIRKKVSVGYIVGDDFEQEASKDKGGIPTRRYTSWMPIELSVVPVPADYDGSGFGRSAADDEAPLPKPLQDALERYLQRHPLHPSHSPQRPARPRSFSVPDEEKAAAAAAAAAAATASRKDEHDPSKLGEIATTYDMRDLLPKWLANKTSVEAALRESTDVLVARAKATPKQEVTIDGLSEKDAKRFSYARAIISHMGRGAEKEFNGVDVGFERELSQHLAARAVFQSGKGGLMVPMSLRAGLDSGTSTKGTELKFTQPGDFIDLLRNKTSVIRAGATFLAGLTGPVTFPAQNGAGTASWQGENPGSDASDSNLTLTTVALAFKTLISSTSFSRQLLFSAASGGYDAESMVRNDLALVCALALDVAGLTGSGTGQPLGLLNNTAIGSVTLGTNGGSVSWNPIVDLETTIGDANGDIAALSYLTNTKQRGVMKKTSVLGNTAGAQPIWTGGIDAGQINGYRAIASNQVPRNLTKGTSTTVCSALIFGAFDQMIIGQFGPSMEILVDELRLKKQAMIEVTQIQYLDICVKYAAAFAAIKDAL